jgi:PAS domain S-box-containing protein
MRGKRYSAQYVVGVFIVVALAIETLPLWLVSLNRIENVGQFQRTVTTLTLSTAITIGLGTWLFMRVANHLNKEIEQNEKLYRELFASIKSPVVAFTEDLKITFCNTAWAELVGGKTDKLLGCLVSDVLPGWEDTTLRTAYRAVIGTGWQQQYSVDYQGRHFDVWLWGTPSGLLLFAEDITQRRQIAEQLELARQQQSELAAIQRTAATAAHEINNPLAAQRLLLEALRDDLTVDGFPKEEFAEMLDQAMQQAKRIGRTVEALQQVTRPQYKTYIGNTQMLDLGRSRGPGSAIT